MHSKQRASDAPRAIRILECVDSFQCLELVRLDRFPRMIFQPPAAIARLPNYMAIGAAQCWLFIHGTRGRFGCSFVLSAELFEHCVDPR
jgi:hypothetical protein